MYRRPAFTLVELVTALALASMLLAAIAGVLVYSHRQLNQVNDLSMRRWEASVIRIVRRDIQLASQISISDGWIWLSGEFPVPGSDTYVDRVGYGIAPWIRATGGETAARLSPTSENQNERSSPPPVRKETVPTVLVRVCGREGQPIVVGPSRIVMERLDDNGTPQPLSANPIEIAKQLRMWLWVEDSSEPALVTDLVAH